MKLFRKGTFGTPSTYYYWRDKQIGRRTGGCYYFFNERYVGWHDWGLDITWRECGYESGYGEIHISILGWHSVFKTRIKSKRFPDGDCDAPTYGIQIHDNTLWIMKGGNGNLGGGSKWCTWDIPFFTLVRVRHDVECKDDIMRDVESIRHDGQYHYVPLEDSDLVNVQEYLYTDSYDGAKIPCKFWVEEWEWRPKWLTWTGLFKRVRRYIEIIFSDEVGKDKGEWKGGCTGCSYDIKPNETPLECLKRMERERKF